MSRVKKNKSGIFLMERMAVVLIILLTITTCVNIFFKSQKLSDKSYILTNACSQTENVVQLLKHDRGKIKSFQSYYNIDGTSVYFDRNFNVCKKEKGIYKIEVKQQSIDNKLILSDVEFSEISSKNIIYSLNTTIFEQEGGNNE